MMQTHIQKMVVALGLMLALAALAGVAAAATGWPDQYRGQPSVGDSTQSLYLLWHDDGGWHLRWLVGNRPHIFSGVVTTNGEFRGARAAGGGLPVWLSAGGGRLNFFTATLFGSDGLDFQTTGTEMTFSLSVDQRAVGPGQVFIGRQGLHPTQMPFTLTPQVLAVVAPGDERYHGIDIKEVLEEQGR